MKKLNQPLGALVLGKANNKIGNNGIGFIAQTPDVAYKHEQFISQPMGHITTIAPTGAGKGVNCIIPALLSYSGSVVVIDPKGENYETTQRYRRSLGHNIVVLDPFEITSASHRDCLNPLDFVERDKNAIDNLKTTAENILLSSTSSTEPFWDLAARQLIITLLAILKFTRNPFLQCLGELVHLLNLNHIELKKEILHAKSLKIDGLSEYLQPFDLPDRTAECILATARVHLDYLLSQQVQESLRYTTFDMQHLIDGKPTTIYLVIPPDKLSANQGLLRAWLGCFISQLVKRKTQPELSTLFLLDECAQLGHMPQLCKSITLLRGYGVRVWSFWQDFYQLQTIYPKEWKTIINNSAAIQMFGLANYQACSDAADLLGFFCQRELLLLNNDELVIQQSGQLPIKAKRINYLTDSEYAERFDMNPYYAYDFKKCEALNNIEYQPLLCSK